MGYGYIAGMLAYGANVETALLVHCTYNVFPPIDTRFIPSLLEAIDLVNVGDLWAEVELPNGIKMKAGNIVAECKLDAFIDTDE